MSEEKEYEEGVFAWKHGIIDCPYDPWLYPELYGSWSHGWNDMEARSARAWNDLSKANHE